MKDSEKAYDLIVKLSQRQIYLSSDGEKLRYRAPEGSLDEQIKAALRNNKDGFIECLEQHPGFTLIGPLSYNQQSMFFIHLFEPLSAAYNLALSMRFQDIVDPAKLRKAIYDTIKRHEQLRTTYGYIEVEETLTAVQFIHDELDPSFEVIDTSNWPEERLDQELQTFYEAPFDLQKGPTVRSGLFTRGPKDAVFVLALHHVAMDGWSMNLIKRDLAAAYRGELSDQKISERQNEYVNYAISQRNLLQSEAGRNSINFWTNIHTPPAPALEFTNAAERPAKRKAAGATHFFQLDSTHREALETAARRSGLTTFALALSVFEWLLYERSGIQDVVVGIPIIGHNEIKYRNTVGYFVNTVPLRSTRSAPLPFIEHARLTAQELRYSLEHRDTPFGAIVENLSRPRDISRTPLFQVMFHMLSRKTLGDVIDLLYPFKDSPSVDFGGISSVAYPLVQQNGQFDLTLELIDNGKDILGLLKYCSDLFSEKDAENIAQDFCSKLDQVLKNQNIELFPLMYQSNNYNLPDTEMHKLLIEWNNTDADYPKNACLHKLIEEQASQTPESMAVEFENQSLTYQELDNRSNKIAEHLQMLGVGPERLVAIYLERSVEMVVALLGVLKAGGAYLPLDVNFPTRRLEVMLEDANPIVLITSKGLKPDLPAHKAEVVCIEHLEQGVFVNRDTEEPTSENLAYIIYTSGSTGKPKGVQITHRALINFLYAMLEKPGLSASDTLLSVTTISFDIFGLELWLPLITGAKVIIASTQTAMDGKLLASAINNNVTVMQATPATWRLLLDSGWEGKSDLKILIGGEAWSPELASILQKKCNSIWNMYGPTETTVWSSIFKVSDRAPILLGRPISNTEFYIVDAQMEIVPVGKPGELLIGGDGLARGYLNRPELTADKFVSNPFSPRTASRLYRTGDMARYLPDGNLEYLGRSDQQVKIRGFRIELGEIESALENHPAVKQAVVKFHKYTENDARLFAYVTLHDGNDRISFRKFLKNILPDYMIPSNFTVLAKMPLTSNKKIDRKALPIPDRTRPELDNEFILPQNQLQELLVRTWCEILQINQAGIDDAFFDLGGNSLLSVQVITKLEQELKISIPVVKLYQFPTIRLFSNYLESDETRKNDQQVHMERGKRQRQTMSKRRLSIRK